MKKKQQYDLSIDEYALESEWMDQPSRYQQAASMVAMARKEYDEAKAELEVVRAELDRSIREDPDDYGLTKLTESLVASTVVIQKQYRQAQQEVIDRRHRLDVVQGYLTALDHRKSALSKLVDLYLAGYFSKPRASKKSKEEMDELEKSMTRLKVRQRLMGD